MKIGVCFNADAGRRDGTANLALRALTEMKGVDAKHVRAPNEKSPVILGKNGKPLEHWRPDFWLYVDDGMDHVDWMPPSPNAYWAVDTHLGYGYRLHRAKQFDRVFTAQKDAVYQFEKDGATNVSWLPLACHPKAHPTKAELLEGGMAPERMEQEWDIAFVGFMNDSHEPGFNSRVDYLDSLFWEFPNSWLSTRCFFEEMAMRYAKAKVGFNISIKKDLNMRFFEVLSLGVPLLTNRDVFGVSDIFEDGVDYFGYEGPPEMISVAKEVLGNESLRRSVADAGHMKVRKGHTYQNRMASVIEAMEAL